MPAERFRELDGLRGVAAVSVVLYHFTTHIMTKHPELPAPPISFPWGLYGVQLFFLISGYVILMSAQRAVRPSDFAASRFVRLYPTYWIAVTVGIILTLTLDTSNGELGWGDMALNYTMIQRLLFANNVDEVYWTLTLEMQFYLLVLAVLILTRARLTDRLAARLAYAWTGISLVLAILVGGHTRGVQPWLVDTPTKIILNLALVEWGPLFSAGMLAYLARREAKYRAPAVLLMLAAVLVAGILHSVEEAVPVAVVGLIFFVVVFRQRTVLLLTPPFQWFGKISYSLYIGHVLIGTWILSQTVPHLGWTLSILLAFVVVTVYSRCLYQVGEVWFTRWMRAQVDRLRTTRTPIRTESEQERRAI